MNVRQFTAYTNPCYTMDESKNPLSTEIFDLDGLEVKSILKVLGIFDNEVWNAVAIVRDKEGRQLKESDLTGNQVNRLKEHVASLLQGVGKDEIHHISEESDFEAIRMLSQKEAKGLKSPDIAKYFDIPNRQRIALANPFPSMVDMISKKYSHIVYFGGLKFSTILTIGFDEEGSSWHASCAVFNERDEPYKMFETPYGHGMMRIKITAQMLKHVGMGQMSTGRPQKEDTTFNVFKKVSYEEQKQLPKIIQQDISSILRQAARN